VKTVTTRTNASRTGDGFLTNRTRGIRSNKYVTLCCCLNLLLGWSNHNGVKKVPTDIDSSNRDVQHHVCDSIGLTHVLAKNGNESVCVSHVRRHKMTATPAVKKADGSVKRAFHLKKFMDNVQNVNFGLRHILFPFENTKIVV
jgi:hypothetical protein